MSDSTHGIARSNSGGNRDRVISMWCLGRLGKFGNQLFQYGFLRIYAKLHDLEVETPGWIGERLFGFRDPSPARNRVPAVDAWIRYYARRREFGVFALLDLVRWIRESWPSEVEWIEFDERILSPECDPLEDVNFWGTFLFPTRYYSPHKAYFRSLYKPLPEIESKLKPMVDRLRGKGRTLVGIQLRRGDFWQFPDCSLGFIAPASWYVRWLEEVWREQTDPVLLICSDEPEKVRHEFARFNPLTAADLDNDTLREMADAGFGFYPDFYLLSQCDVLGISSCSFALVAAMLNERCNRFFRPDAEVGKLVPFDPWDTEVYADRVDHAQISTVFRRAAYRWRNVKRMGAAHGKLTLMRNALPRLHRRLSFELAAVLASGFMKSMLIVNRVSKRWRGKSVSPIDVFTSDRLLRFFTGKFNK